MEPPQYEPSTTSGRLGMIRGFHLLDPLWGLGSNIIIRVTHVVTPVLPSFNLLSPPASKPEVSRSCTSLEARKQLSRLKDRQVSSNLSGRYVSKLAQKNVTYTRNYRINLGCFPRLAAGAQKWLNKSIARSRLWLP